MPARWNDLLTIACSLIHQVNAEHRIIDEWTLGGGTALMLQIDHRESHDIDIFLEDPQMLSFLDPARQDFDFTVAPSGYRGDGTGFQKIVFDGVGEIDFIVSASMTENPATKRQLAGQEILLETIPEIIVKKVAHRGANILPRDIFDIAAASLMHKTALMGALAGYPTNVERTIKRIINSDRDFIGNVISQLQIKPAFIGLKSDAIDIALNTLRESLSKPAR